MPPEGKRPVSGYGRKSCLIDKAPYSLYLFEGKIKTGFYF